MKKGISTTPPNRRRTETALICAKVLFVRVVEIIKSPASTTLLLFIFIYFLIFQYGKLSFYRDPGSRFYDQRRAFERGYSEYREAQAHTYIEAANSSDHGSFPKAGRNPTICVAISTITRENINYLESTVGSILEGLTEAERSDLYFGVHFGNTNPSIHPSWGQPWLENLVDRAYTYDTPDVIYTHMSHLEHNRVLDRKVIVDYTYALETCLDTGASWIVMFEDDLIVADGWFARTLTSLYDIEVNSLKTGREWLHMRLFNQERSIGWASDELGSHHEFWITIGIVGFIIGVVYSTRSHSTFIRRHMGTERLIVICIIAVPAFVILFFQMGKASTLPPSPGVFEEPFGCCSQGMVFPSRQVPLVIDYMRSRKKGKVDALLDDLANESNLARHSLYPVQIQHVGIDFTRELPEGVWSMAFEDLKPKRLRKEHQKMVNMLYAETLSTQT